MPALHPLPALKFLYMARTLRLQRARGGESWTSKLNLNLRPERKTSPPPSKRSRYDELVLKLGPYIGAFSQLPSDSKISSIAVLGIGRQDLMPNTNGINVYNLQVD